ncbi:MAG: hypothetical protein ACREXW_06910 [Gammaproteobacteria bacterium]
MAGRGPVAQSKGCQVIQESTGVALGHHIDGNVSPVDGGEGVPGPNMGGGCLLRVGGFPIFELACDGTQCAIDPDARFRGGCDPPFAHRGICSRLVVSACAETSLAPVPIPRIDKTHRATLNVTRDFLLLI